MFQPRLGIAYDINGNGKQVIRANAGIYYARIPGLNLASSRSTDGSRGQSIFRNSALTPIPGRAAGLWAIAADAAGGTLRAGNFRVRQGLRESPHFHRDAWLRAGDREGDCGRHQLYPCAD